MASTDRFVLPMIEPGQAGKEITHNEALLRVDMLLHPCLETLAAEVPPIAPQPGCAWGLGANPAGAWAGRGGQIAVWTTGGWRFLSPATGMAAWRRDLGCQIRFTDRGWVGGAAVPAPAGGSTVDTAARSAINELRNVLTQHGLLKP